MVGRMIFCAASVLFFFSLFLPAVLVGDEKFLTGLQTFIYTLRYATANVFGAGSIADFVVNFIALVATGANFVFVFWAMLVLTPTKITSLRWFWWISLLFLLAAIYTGVQTFLTDQITLQSGYFLWLSALVLMLVAPVVSRIERERQRRYTTRNSVLTESSPVELTQVTTMAE